MGRSQTVMFMDFKFSLPSYCPCQVSALLHEPWLPHAAPAPAYAAHGCPCAACLCCPAGKIIAAVCHGPAGLAQAKGSDGQPLVNARQVTGFTNSEEEAVGKTKVGGQYCTGSWEGCSL